jgi:outer membrane protein assembly factor BamB
MAKGNQLLFGKVTSYGSRLIHIFIFAFFLISLTLPNHLSIAQASSTHTYYVSTSGSDSNSGTQDKPWKTIQKAANSVTAGDTVTVLAGDYSSERVSVTTSGGSGMQITFQAQGSVTMKGFTIRASYITIDGFYITNTDNDDTNGYGIFYQGSFGIIENNYIYYTTRGGIILYATPGSPLETTNCIVRNNKLDTDSQVGIEVYGRDHLVEGNEVWGTIQYHPKWTSSPSWVDADGIRFFGQGHIFRNNYIHDIIYGIPENVNPHIDCFQTFADGYHEAASNILFEQNNCYIPTYQASVEKGSAFTIENGSNLTIRNNILQAFLNIYINNGSSIIIENNIITGNLSFPDSLNPGGIFLGNTPNMTIRNNVFYNIPGYTIYTGDTTSQQNLSAGYNWVFWSDGKSASGKAYLNDTFNVDPKFLDPSNNNFQLQADSPMIDVGYAVTDVPNDYAGVARPQGNGVDIGPYEFVGVTAPIATNTSTALPASPTTTSPPTQTATPVPTVTSTKIPTSAQTVTLVPTVTSTQNPTPTQTGTLVPTSTLIKVPTSTQIKTLVPTSTATTLAPTVSSPNTPTQTSTKVSASTPTRTPTLLLPSTTSTSTQEPSITPTIPTLPVSTATSIPTTCPDCALADSPWPMAGNNDQHSSRSSFSGPDQPNLIWSYNSLSGMITNIIMDEENNLFAGSGTSVISLSNSGENLWSFNTAGTVTSLVLTSNNTLYFGSADQYFYSISSLNGQLNWAFHTNGPIVASPGIGSDGTLYVPSTDGNLYGLQANGSLLWVFASGDSIQSSPVSLSDGSICFGTANGLLYSLSANGNLLWSLQLNGSISSSPAVGSNDTINLGTSSGLFYSISSTGEIIWSFQTGGAISSPAIDESGNLYFGSADKKLYSISSSGGINWVYLADGIVGSPIIGQDGTIYVGSQDGTLLAVQDDGNLLWKFSLGGNSSINPIIGSSGNLFAASAGNIASIENTTTPITNTEWKVYLPLAFNTIP